MRKRIAFCHVVDGKCMGTENKTFFYTKDGKHLFIYAVNVSVCKINLTAVRETDWDYSFWRTWK